VPCPWVSGQCMATCSLHGMATCSLHGMATCSSHGMATCSSHGMATCSLHGMATCSLHGMATCSLHDMMSRILVYVRARLAAAEKQWFVLGTEDVFRQPLISESIRPHTPLPLLPCSALAAITNSCPALSMHSHMYCIHSHCLHTGVSHT
jgi:hypothetical protein